MTTRMVRMLTRYNAWANKEATKPRPTLFRECIGVRVCFFIPVRRSACALKHKDSLGNSARAPRPSATDPADR